MKKVFTFLALGALIFLSACTSDTLNPDHSKGEVIGMDRTSNLDISYIYNRHVKDWETRSIGESLTGDEHTHGHLTLRTQDKAREGMYFWIMFAWDVKEISLGSLIEVYVDTTKRAKIQKYEFIIPETHSVFREVKLGITGTDWIDEDEQVNAWKLVVKRADGKIITEKQSWLWSIKAEEKKISKTKNAQVDKK